MYKYLKSIKLSYLYLFYAFVFSLWGFVSLLYFITILNYSLNLYSIITNEYRTHKYNNKIYNCMKRKIYLKYKDTIVKIFMFYLKFS